MSANKLVKVNRKNEIASPLNQLGNIESTLDKLWSMFQTQVNRNAELMLIIQQQQQDLQKINSSPVVIQTVEEPKSLPAIHPPDMPKLGFDKLMKIKKMFREIGIKMRSDAMFSFINIFHYLYHAGGEAYPAELITLSGTGSASFYRYLTRMRDQRIIKIKGGKAIITELGRKIYNEVYPTRVSLQADSYKFQFGRDMPEDMSESFKRHNGGNNTWD